MGSRYGLIVSSLAALVALTGPAPAQTGPTSLAPPPVAAAPTTPAVPPQQAIPAAAAAETQPATLVPAVRPLVQTPRGSPPGSAQSASALRQTSIGVPRTLNEALAATYVNQPILQAERAKLRATDESVPAALAGW